MDVESNAVRHLLNAGVGELRESLRDAGLEMKEFHIHVENHEEHQAAQGDGQYGSEDDREEGSGDKEAGEDMEPETSEESGDTSERAIDFQA